MNYSINKIKQPLSKEDEISGGVGMCKANV